jgi:hypothetical protein
VVKTGAYKTGGESGRADNQWTTGNKQKQITREKRQEPRAKKQITNHKKQEPRAKSQEANNK